MQLELVIDVIRLITNKLAGRENVTMAIANRDENLSVLYPTTMELALSFVAFTIANKRINVMNDVFNTVD